MKLTNKQKARMYDDLEWIKDQCDLYKKHIESDKYLDLYALRDFKERTKYLDEFKKAVIYLQKDEE